MMPIFGFSFACVLGRFFEVELFGSLGVIVESLLVLILVLAFSPPLIALPLPFVVILTFSSPLTLACITAYFIFEGTGA